MILVSTLPEDPTKVKGDLLEKLARDLLSAQDYQVTEEIRTIGAELDLLCTHKVSGKEIYVECKAQSANIGAPILRQLLGTVVSEDFAEGWLITTSNFGKDAKGWERDWKSRTKQDAHKLSFYTPEKIIESLKAARIVCNPPHSLAESLTPDGDKLGDWSLLLSPFGRYWTVYTIRSGVPHGVLFFESVDGSHISNSGTLENIAKLDSVFSDYEMHSGKDTNTRTDNFDQLPTSVVEVQTGESLYDYRPARPEDFVGRTKAQKDILGFFESVRTNETTTRIIAITGNSGLGKSSLIAKIRDRTRNKRYKNKYFSFAVDMRGARSPLYVTTALLQCLKAAQSKGFGSASIQLQLVTPSNPLASPSISEYLRTVSDEGKLITLLIDQFEELYTKPDLFPIFNAARELFIDAASEQTAFALGFAWKTDSTTQQDHPAYHLWHDLSDMRKNIRLNVFDAGEVKTAITSFEKESRIALPAELRHQVSYSCQGFPWLLKKLCIHLYEQLEAGKIADSTLLEIDAASLFQRDIDDLSQPQLQCLKLIANKAPADWSEIIEIAGADAINSLVGKRLVIKSGDRLNVYWDIFRDYLITGNTPIVSFNYIPTSDISSMLKVARDLDAKKYKSAQNIASNLDLEEKSVWNVGADLVLLGVAERNGTSFKLHRDLLNGEPETVLLRIREKVDKHIVKIRLYKEHAGQTVGPDTVLSIVKSCFSGAQYSDKTWAIYTNRFAKLFQATGFLDLVGPKYLVQNSKIVLAKVQRRERKKEVFSAMASPDATCQTLTLVLQGATVESLMKDKRRNALQVLKRFNLVTGDNYAVYANKASVDKLGGVEAVIWNAAQSEETIRMCVDVIVKNPEVSGAELGEMISAHFQAGWKSTSKLRTGIALKKWSTWIIEGEAHGVIPSPPRRNKRQAE